MTPTETLLSGLLRDAFTEAPALPPAADRAAARARWLRERRQRTPSCGGAPPSFAELARGVSERAAGYQEAHANYRRFLTAVASALGGEAPPDEVATAAAAAFRALHLLDDGGSLSQARRLLGAGDAPLRSPSAAAAAAALGCGGPPAAALM